MRVIRKKRVCLACGRQGCAGREPSSHIRKDALWKKDYTYYCVSGERNSDQGWTFQGSKFQLDISPEHFNKWSPPPGVRGTGTEMQIAENSILQACSYLIACDVQEGGGFTNLAMETADSTSQVHGRIC